MKNKNLPLIITAGLLVVALAVWALSRGQSAGPALQENNVSAPTSTLTPTSTPGSSSDNTMENDSGTKEISITARQWEFTPSTIQVQQGQTIRLVIKNQDVDHGFNVPGLDIDKILPAGETTTIEFTADQTGTFPFSCSVNCGQGHSDMTGQIIVN